jgi:hypothetical protein
MAYSGEDMGLIAVARYLAAHSPTERAELQTADIARRLMRGGELYQAFFAGLPPCLIGLEACATAHHWARELIALGHETRLMPPGYVKAYVKRNNMT